MTNDDWAGFPPTGLEPRGCPTPGACSCPADAGDVAALQEQNARLRAALATYGRHDPACQTLIVKVGPCDCGLDAVLSGGVA
jgi:hypothetical protein